MLACAVNMFLFGGSLSKFANCRIVYGGDTVKPLEKGMSNEPIYSITSVRAYNSNSYRCQKQIKWELRKTYYALGVGSHADGVGCVGIDTGLFWPTPRRLCADTRWQQLELIHFALISCDISGFWFQSLTPQSKTKKAWPRRQSLHRVGSPLNSTPRRQSCNGVDSAQTVAQVICYRSSKDKDKKDYISLLITPRWFGLSISIWL